MRYFKNTSWLFAEKILRTIVGLAVGIWVARYLEPERYGLFSYAQSFVGLFSAVAALGLDQIVVRELVKYPERRSDLLGTAFCLKLLGALVMFVMLGVAIRITSNDRFTNILVFIIASGVIFQSFNVIDMYFQSRVMSRYVVYANIISLFASSFVKILLILMHATLVAFAWVVLLDSGILALGMTYFYIKHNPPGGKKFTVRLNTAKLLLKDSWPVILSGGLLMIQARIDQVMIKEMVGNAQTGYYSVALRLIEAFGFIPMILNSSLFPALANARNKSESVYNIFFLNYYRLSFLMFLIASVPIFFFSQKIVILLFGEAYRQSGALLSLMAIRLFFTNMGVARGAFINLECLFRFSLLAMLVGTGTNVFLNYILIPVYYSKGAVAATIISFAVTLFALDSVYSKTRGNVLLQIKGILTFYKLSIKELK